MPDFVYQELLPIDHHDATPYRLLTTDGISSFTGGGYDFVHLSNILDWLSAEEAGRLLARAAAVLRAGGAVLIRQLNSTLEIPPLGPDFEWQPDAGLYSVTIPGQHEAALALPWGGTSHPVWFKKDPRVASVKVLGGVFNKPLMLGVPQIVAAALKTLNGAHVVVNTLVWETGYRLDGLSEVSRVIDQTFAGEVEPAPLTRSATRPRFAPRPVWVQAAESIGPALS